MNVLEEKDTILKRINVYVVLIFSLKANRHRLKDYVSHKLRQCSGFFPLYYCSPGENRKSIHLET